MRNTSLKDLRAATAFVSWMIGVALLPRAVGAGSNMTPESKWSGLEPLNSAGTKIWVEDIGSGFEPDVRSIGLSLGGYYGLAKFGSHQAHHMALTSFSYSHMLGPVQCPDHWYRGNWEFQIELFGGAQFNPEVNWVVGLTPHLRYNFATGTRWIPFADFGAGVTATEICSPDLGSCFQFNEQAGLGTHWFLSGNIALTVEALYMHISNAGIREPNCGVNGINGMIGLTYFF